VFLQKVRQYFDAMRYGWAGTASKKMATISLLAERVGFSILLHTEPARASSYNSLVLVLNKYKLHHFASPWHPQGSLLLVYVQVQWPIKHGEKAWVCALTHTQ